MEKRPERLGGVDRGMRFASISVFLLLVCLVGSGLAYAADEAQGSTLGAASASWAKYVEYEFFYAEAREKDYSRDYPPYQAYVLFSFHLVNQTSKTIVGLEYNVRFRDAFGDILHQERLKEHSTLRPGDKFPKNAFWYVEDRPFERDDAYDRLVGPTENGSLRAEIAMVRLAFDDGEILTFSGEEWELDRTHRLLRDVQERTKRVESEE